MARIVLVVPCFNERDRLDAEAFAEFKLEGHYVDFRFVDDGSTDATSEVLNWIARERKGVTVQRLPENVGKAEAVRAGFIDAFAESPDYLGYWDADLAAPLSELADFVALMEARRDIDVVLGSRVKLLGRTIERLAWRHYSGRISATLVSLSLKLPVYDTQCGHKLFRATELARHVFAEPFRTRWVFDVEILARFLTMDPLGRDHAARSIYELPLKQWIDVTGSKVRAKDFGRALADLWTIRRVYGL